MLDKLFNHIELQLKEETDKYKKSKICKYIFELSKIGILSLSVGLSFISIFAILSAVCIPIIDAAKNNSDIDKRLYNTKLKKDLLKELMNYKSNTYKELTEDEIKHLYDKLTNKLSIINTFQIRYKYMKFINFDTVLKCDKNNVINKNEFTPQHCSNFLIVGKTGIGKTNFLLNILHLNPVWDEIYIYINDIDN